MEFVTQTLSIGIAVLAMLINLITIIRFTSTLERRLTSIETIQSLVVKPKMEELESMLKIIYSKSIHVRREDYDDEITPTPLVADRLKKSKTNI